MISKNLSDKKMKIVFTEIYFKYLFTTPIGQFDIYPLNIEMTCI